MKTLSEMELEDISSVYEILEKLDHAGCVPWEYTEILFFSQGQFQTLCDLKLKLLIISRMLEEAGCGLSVDLFFMEDLKDPADDEQYDDWDSICEAWQTAEEQMERLYVDAMERAGFEFCRNWAACETITDWLGDSDTENQLRKGMNSEHAAGWVKDTFSKDFYGCDKAKQLSDACAFASMNVSDSYACYYVFAFRSKRIGKILSHAKTHRVADSCVTLMKGMLDLICVPLMRYIEMFADAFISADDGAYVIRVATGACSDTGEEIEFALFRPVVLMYLPLVTRLCEIYEAQHPEVMEQEVEEHGTHEKACA